MNYYNDNEPYVCEWLKNLIAAGHLPPGDVDSRDIREIAPDDLDGYIQCHFFAGIGGWPLALQMSGYDRLVCWTGSCPCQPFSAAGKGGAATDARHLWPVWFELIKAVRPPVIFSEQVEAAIGWGWLDLVHTDMEQEGYTIRSAVLPACGVGAPHIRQRLWFELADSNPSRCREGRPGEAGNGRDTPRLEPTGLCSHHWRDLLWLPCTDGKQRPTQPGIFPLAHGIPARVAKLRAAGNAIVPQVAAEFIRAAMNG